MQSRFMEVFQQTFTLKRVSRAKLAPEYSHPSIELYVMKRRRGHAQATPVPSD